MWSLLNTTNTVECTVFKINFQILQLYCFFFHSSIFSPFSFVKQICTILAHPCFQQQQVQYCINYIHCSKLYSMSFVLLWYTIELLCPFHLCYTAGTHQQVCVFQVLLPEGPDLPLSSNVPNIEFHAVRSHTLYVEALKRNAKLESV